MPAKRLSRAVLTTVLRPVTPTAAVHATGMTGCVSVVGSGTSATGQRRQRYIASMVSGAPSGSLPRVSYRESGQGSSEEGCKKDGGPYNKNSKNDQLSADTVALTEDQTQVLRRLGLARNGQLDTQQERTVQQVVGAGLAQVLGALVAAGVRGADPMVVSNPGSETLSNNTSSVSNIFNPTTTTKNDTIKSSTNANMSTDGGSSGESPKGNRGESDSYIEKLENLARLVADIDQRIPHMLHSASTASPVSSRAQLSQDIVLRLFPDSRQFYETEVEEEEEEKRGEAAEGGAATDGKSTAGGGRQASTPSSDGKKKRKLHLKIPLPSGFGPFSHGAGSGPGLMRPSFHGGLSGYPQLGRESTSSSSLASSSQTPTDDEGSGPGGSGMYLSVPIPQIIKGRVAYAAAIRAVQLVVTTLFVRPETQLHVISSYFVGPSGELLSLGGGAQAGVFAPVRGTDIEQQAHKDAEGSANGDPHNHHHRHRHSHSHVADMLAGERAPVVPKKYVVKWRTCSEGWCSHDTESSGPSPSAPLSSLKSGGADGADTAGSAGAEETPFSLVERLIRKALMTLNPRAEAGEEGGPGRKAKNASYLMGIFEFEFTGDCTQINVHTIQDVEHLRDAVEEDVVIGPASTAFF